jgi:hypothetical protein
MRNFFTRQRLCAFLNCSSSLTTILALLIFRLPFMDVVYGEYEGGEQLFLPLFLYLCLAVISSLISLTSLIVGGFRVSRFPYYCFAVTWTPLILLLIGGIVFTMAGIKPS